MSVRLSTHGAVLVVEIDRPEVRNAVDRPTAAALYDAFADFEADDELAVAVLHGAGGTFCAGADLRAVGDGDIHLQSPHDSGRAPMGPSRMALGKPVIAAIEGHAVAGGLELALWCDLRVAAEDAVLGVFCRRWGVPLIDGGTARLPRLIGLSHALDLILTGRPVAADEARGMGLVNRVSAPGEALADAVILAEQLAAFPQACLRSDRSSAHEGVGLELPAALANEWANGSRVVAEAVRGAARFVGGAGRHGRLDETSS